MVVTQKTAYIGSVRCFCEQRPEVLNVGGCASELKVVFAWIWFASCTQRQKREVSAASLGSEFWGKISSSCQVFSFLRNILIYYFQELYFFYVKVYFYLISKSIKQYKDKISSLFFSFTYS